MADAPFVVLRTFKPKKYRGSYIGPRLLELLSKYNFTPLQDDKIQRNAKPIWSDYKQHAEVRRAAVKGSQAESWHQDGDTSTDDMNFAMVLWTNHTPTLLRDKSGEVWQPEPFEVICFRNLAVHHKRPDAAASHKRRWSFRQRIDIPSNPILP